MENLEASPRVLSIQSHTVHGYVGNKAAVFPLQLHGFDVEAINSVQFSNHTGYKVCKGEVLNGDQLRELCNGLSENSLLDYSYILTGYIGSKSFLHEVLDLIWRIRQSSNPNLIYFCDPVLGDNDQLYVPNELIPVYAREVLPVSTIVAPNHFECQWIMNFLFPDQTCQITTESAAIRAILHIHSLGPSVVVLKSFPINDSELELIASVKRKSTSADIEFAGCEMIKIRVPMIAAKFVGSGDVTSALLLAWIHKTDLLRPNITCSELSDRLSDVAVKVVSSMYRLLSRTARDESYELRLIQSKYDLEGEFPHESTDPDWVAVRLHCKISCIALDSGIAPLSNLLTDTSIPSRRIVHDDDYFEQYLPTCPLSEVLYVFDCDVEGARLQRAFELGMLTCLVRMHPGDSLRPEAKCEMIHATVTSPSGVLSLIRLIENH